VPEPEQHTSLSPDGAESADESALLTVRNLHVAFRARGGPAVAVDDLSFQLAPGQVLGIVGESGSGKSVSMLSMLGLVPNPNLELSGSASFRGTELVGAEPSVLRAIRGRRIAWYPRTR